MANNILDENMVDLMQRDVGYILTNIDRAMHEGPPDFCEKFEKHMKNVLVELELVYELIADIIEKENGDE